MREHHTTDLESLLLPIPEDSLLRSPKASEGAGGALGEAEVLRRGNTVGVRDQVMDLVAGQGLKVSRAELLPTPAAEQFNDSENVDEWLERRDKVRTKLNNGNGMGMPLNISVRLLPTPNTMEHRETKTPEQIAELKKRSPGGYRNMREVVVNELLPTVTVQDSKNTGGQSQFERNTLPLNTQVLQDWGKFAPAIERWEQVIGRKAPTPTKPDGKDGAHRLSSLFTEWMMGLPEGWVTDVGLTRNEELKACGNGVVPQQAALALRMLLDGIGFDVKRERERERLLPTPTVSDIFTGSLSSTQQKPDSMHSVTLPQAVKNI